jgi:phenylacetate-coenzyme A ligase PaaK-like adenylate-forming protein
MNNKTDKSQYIPTNNTKKSEELLNTALEHVPFYRKHWKQFDPGKEADIDTRFNSMPILTKADMRKCFPAGLADDRYDIQKGLDDNKIEYTFTSGTTGDKVINLWNQEWWHASEMASWKLNPALANLHYPPRQATLASSLNVGIHCEEDLPMDHRIMGNLLYLNEKMNIICWKEFHLRRMVNEINEYKPDVLEANPSLLAKLCFWAIDNDIAIYTPKVITLTYELPSAAHLNAIKSVFNCPIVSSYGTTETGFVMDSCQEGRFHQNVEACRIDFIPVKPEFGPEGLGRILVSAFGNPWSNIIRFDVGDFVFASHDGCTCGHNEGFVADSIEGRVTNSTFDCTGKIVTTSMVDRAVSMIPGIREYDLIQKTPTKYLLRLVSTKFEAETVKAGAEKLRQLFGAGEFEVHCVKELLPGPAGKYRRTHAEFTFEEWSLMQGSYRF